MESKPKKPFDAREAVRKEYGYTPKRKKMTISEKWRRQAKISKLLPTLEDLRTANKITNDLFKNEK